MKIIPILMTAENAKNIRNGSKTQTRRIINGLNPYTEYIEATYFTTRFPGATRSEVKKHGGQIFTSHGPLDLTKPEIIIEYSWHRCPYGQADDMLAIKEPWWQWGRFAEGTNKWVDWTDDKHPVLYTANQKRHYGPPIPRYSFGYHRRPSIFLPRIYWRTFCMVSEVRVERLQDISEADAEAEGCTAKRNIDRGDFGFSYRNAYRDLWESINGHGSWEKNPWVWAITFAYQPKFKPSDS